MKTRIQRPTTRRCWPLSLRLLWLTLLVLVPGASEAQRPAAKAERLARRVTIYRDQCGVPRVYGPTDASCVFGYLYAQAEDNFWQVEDNYIRALGRAAEVYGESGLAADLMTRALELPRRSQLEYQRADARAGALRAGFRTKRRSGVTALF